MVSINRALIAFAVLASAGPVSAQPAPGVAAAGPTVVLPRHLKKWFSFEDYPMRSLRAQEEGTVRFTIYVGTNGRARDCVVTGSSRSELLDRTTCRLVTTRARFAPATRGGRPVPARIEDEMRWEIPVSAVAVRAY